MASSEMHTLWDMVGGRWPLIAEKNGLPAGGITVDEGGGGRPAPLPGAAENSD
jgi:hypothetical protein